MTAHISKIYSFKLNKINIILNYYLFKLLILLKKAKNVLIHL